MTHTMIKSEFFPEPSTLIEDIEQWLVDEEKALNAGLASPLSNKLTQGWPVDDARTDSETVALFIRQGGNQAEQTSRLFDPAIVAYLRMAVLVGSSLRMEEKAGKNPTGQLFYPTLQMGSGIGRNLKVMRIVTNAPKGKHPRHIADYHDFRARNLKLGKPGVGHREGHLEGNTIAIANALALFDKKSESNANSIVLGLGRNHFERLIRQSLELAWRRETQRLQAEA
jgi:hypothetical protein